MLAVCNEVPCLSKEACSTCRTAILRVGNQLLSWGEITFIQSGINSIHPVNVTALLVADSQLKEALLAVPMISLNAGITDSVSIEAIGGRTLRSADATAALPVMGEKGVWVRAYSGISVVKSED